MVRCGNTSANSVRGNIILHSVYEPHYRLVVILAYDLIRTEELKSKSKSSCPRYGTVWDVTGRGWDGVGMGRVVCPPRAAESKSSQLGGKINVL